MKKPKLGNEYWCIQFELGIVERYYGNRQDVIDDDWKHGNCFPTRKIALRALREVKATMRRISRES